MRSWLTSRAPSSIVRPASRSSNASRRERAAAVQQLQNQVDSLTAQAAPGNAQVARLRELTAD